MEQLRLGSRLRMEWRCGAEVNDVSASQTIPSLLLQPLIENAIYHGIQPLPEGGDIVVSVDVSDKAVTIIVSNPVNSALSNQPRTSEIGAVSTGNGLALANIRHRLTALYGSEGMVQVDKEDAVFTVTLRYPVQPNLPAKNQG